MCTLRVIYASVFFLLLTQATGFAGQEPRIEVETWEARILGIVARSLPMFRYGAGKDLISDERVAPDFL